MEKCENEVRLDTAQYHIHTIACGEGADLSKPGSRQGWATNYFREKMHSVHILRIARPTDKLSELSEMYRKGLNLSILSQFSDHDGFDGIILGHPNHPYHIEFTLQRGHRLGRAPSKDHLLVFYIADRNEWEKTCQHMIASELKQVASYNP